MIRHNQEVERPAELRRLPCGGDDLLATGEPVCLLWPQSVAEGRGIEGIGGVEMRATGPLSGNSFRHTANRPGAFRAAPIHLDTECRCLSRPASCSPACRRGWR